MTKIKTNIHLTIMIVAMLLITSVVLVMKLPRELLLLAIGVATSMILYEKYRYRAGGILAVALLVLYSFSYPKVAFWLFLAIVVNWLILEAIFKKTILYGRRLFFTSCMISITLTLALYLIVNHMPVYITIIPGIIAYNLHYERTANGNFIKTLKLLVLHILILVVVGVILGVG